MFNDLLNKAKKAASSIELESVEEMTKKGKKAIRDKMKDYGVEEHIQKAKEEAKIFSDAVSESAKSVYEENKDVLEKPVSKVSGVVNKVSEHSDVIKWAGGILVGIAFPVTTAVAAGAFFLLSDNEDEVTDEQKEELEKHDVIRSSTSLVEVIINQKDRTVFGKILTGKQKDRTFEEIGVEGMTELLSQLDVENNADHKNTAALISGWLKVVKQKD